MLDRPMEKVAYMAAGLHMQSLAMPEINYLKI